MITSSPEGGLQESNNSTLGQLELQLKNKYNFSSIRFAEDMMLILFLVCILATLVTVHRAACYRSIQDARRNSPLRHLLPIAEDRPPPYMTSMPDSGNKMSVEMSSHDHTHVISADGLTSLMNSAAVPKPASETPPPSYEEALYRSVADNIHN